MLKKNIIANYLGQGWVAVMGFAFIPIYIKYLGIEAYGLIGLFAIMQASISLLDMGMPATLNREMARFNAGARSIESIRDLLRSLEVIVVIIAFLIFGAGFGLSTVLAIDWIKAGNLSIENVQQAVTVMALVVAFRFCEGIYRNALLGLQKQVLYNLLNAATITLRSVGAVAILAWLSPSIQAFFYWQAIVSFLTLFIFATSVYFLLPYSPKFAQFSFSSLRSIWKFAAGMMATSILAFLLTQVDKILVSKLLPLSELGFYAVAGSVAAILGVVITPIAQSFYPRFIELLTRNDKSKLVYEYHLSSQLVTLVAAPIAALLIFHTKGIIYIWSSDYLLADKIAPIVALLVAGTFLNGLMLMPWMLQLAYGWSSFAAKVNTVAVVILVPALIWVVPHFGIIGAGWLWVALNASYVVIAMHFMHRRLIPDEKWIWYRSDIILPVFGVLVIMFGTLQLQPLYSVSRSLFLLYLLGVASLSFVMACLMANHVRPRLIKIIKVFLSANFQ